MSEIDPVDNHTEDVAEQPAAAAAAPKKKRKRASIFRDPVVRLMAFVAGALVVLYLVGVVSALMMGMLTPEEPRTRLERDIAYYERLAMQTPKDTKVWHQYATALIRNRQYRKAQDVIDQAGKAIDQKATQDITAAQAELYFETGRYDKAIKTADEARKKIKAEYDRLKGQSGSPQSRGQEMHANYYGLLLTKAESLYKLGKTKDAIKALDEYLANNKVAADVLGRRGQFKAEAGDKSGAEADFRQALKYVPDDKVASEGLKKIGAK